MSSKTEQAGSRKLGSEKIACLKGRGSMRPPRSVVVLDLRPRMIPAME
jgi:hypothetical protein